MRRPHDPTSRCGATRSAEPVVVDRQHVEPRAAQTNPTPPANVATAEERLPKTLRAAGARRLPPSTTFIPVATEDVANLELMRRRAPPAQGRRRQSRMCYPKAREQEENPSSWPSLTKCKEHALVLDVSPHTLKVCPT